MSPWAVLMTANSSVAVALTGLLLDVTGHFHPAKVCQEAADLSRADLPRSTARLTFILQIVECALPYRQTAWHMRLIGHLPDEVSAATFSDFLSVRGISNLVEAEKEGWAVWIHSEDELAKATKLFAGFLANPTDPQYQPHTRRAREQRRGERPAEGAAADKVVDRKKFFRAALPFGMG